MDLVKQLLHSGWEFAFADYAQVNGPDDLATLTFKPATVPGTNLTDLQAAELVEQSTSATYEDSFAPYKFKDFVYRTEFNGGEAARKKHVFLCFEGLDTVTEIFLNGEKIADTENCHLGYQFDVSGKVSVGPNALVILFRSPMHEGEKRQQQFGTKIPAHLSSNFMFIRKPAYSFFWDWGPELPVSGIFRPAYLKGYDKAEIEKFHVRYQIEGQRVTGTVEVLASGADGASATVQLAGNTFEAPVAEGKAVVRFVVENATLWYPNGAGEAFLYDMEITLSDGEVLDAKQHRIGFRTIEVVRDDRRDGRGKRFLFKVNGKEIFIRGYNWIPVDNSLPRGYYDLYKGNLDLAREGNVNMLRIWGGGYYEDDEFYRLCDERGILVWQDGMFACALYPDTDPHFLSLVHDELAYNIQRLRNFTSLAVWCGENENHWGFDEWWVGMRDRFPVFLGTKIYDEVYPSLVEQYDPDRLYWNGSPYTEQDGVSANNAFQGDTHFWGLHGACEDFAGYLNTAPSFVSETGIQSLPDLRTALTIGEEEDRSIQSFVFDTRNHFENPAKNDRLLKFTGALFRVSGEFDKAVVLSNLAHAEYLKYAVEHWRSQAYDCAGVLIWQINDCWPAISWAVVDYNLIPKACFYYLKRAYAQDMVGFKQRYSIDYGPEANSKGELFVASERDGAKRGVVTMRIVRLDGAVLESHSFPVELDGRGAISLGEVTLPDYKARRFDSVAECTLRWEDGGTTRNVYTFSRPKHMRLTKPELKLTQEAPDRLTISSDRFAKGVYLFHPDMKAIFSDNYFDLMPGEERTIRVTCPVDVNEVKLYSYHH